MKERIEVRSQTQFDACIKAWLLSRQSKSHLLTNIRLLQEAYAVKHGIPIERKFRNRELGPALIEIEEAENDVEQMQMTLAQENERGTR